MSFFLSGTPQKQYRASLNALCQLAYVIEMFHDSLY